MFVYCQGNVRTHVSKIIIYFKQVFPLEQPKGLCETLLRKKKGKENYQSQDLSESPCFPPTPLDVSPKGKFSGLCCTLQNVKQHLTKAR
jgi:hypothetical protein